MKITNPLRTAIPSLSSAIITLFNLTHHPHGRLNYGAYGHLLQFCADRRLVRHGKHLHARLILFSVTLDNFLASKVINFYSKCGQIWYARKVFDEMLQRNTWVYNAMLIAYSNHDMNREILGLFCSFARCSFVGVKADNFSLTCVLKALSSLFSDVKLAREIHCYVLRHGYDLDLFVVNALITYYSRCDEMGFARRVFDLMGRRDIVTWNSMISAYAQGGYYENCLKMYKHMLGDTSLRPNEVTVVSVLQACAQLKDLVFGMEVHQFLIENKIEMDISVCNSIIALYAKCGSLDYARELFEGMSERDEITYGALISGYMIHGYVDKALDLFRDMEKPAISTWNGVISGFVQNNEHKAALCLIREMLMFGFKPNSVTISSILPALSHFSNLKAGRTVHAYTIRNNLDQNIYVATAMIDTYAKCGFLHGAFRVFKQTRDRSVILWTSMIAAYAAHGLADEALSLFQDMLNCGIQPDPVTFTAILTALAHTGDVKMAWEIFEEMKVKYGIERLDEHYSCMVSVLSRSGKLPEAAEFIKKMPMEPSAKAWGAMLNGAAVCGEVEVGKFAFDKLLEIEPENTGNYTIMANLYSQAGKWEEAKKVREMMNTLNLKKIPGSSR